MKRAKALGIDAFALNIGVDPYTDTQLNFAYESAARNDMKVFISFDFNWYNTGQASAVGQKIRQYGSLAAQLKVDGKVFASSFAGDGLDINQMQSAAGTDVYFAPNFHPGTGNFNVIQGALNWMAWDNNGDNKAPSGGRNVSVAEGDKAYVNALGGKAYVARMSLCPFDSSDSTNRRQLPLDGSLPTSVRRCLTARTGCSPRICCGTTAGSRSWTLPLGSWRLSPGTTMASRTTLPRCPRRIPTTAPPNGLWICKLPNLHFGPN